MAKLKLLRVCVNECMMMSWRTTHTHTSNYPYPCHILPLPPCLACVSVFLLRLVTSYEYFAHALPTISHFVQAMTTTTPHPRRPPPPFLRPLLPTFPCPCCLVRCKEVTFAGPLPPTASHQARIQSQLVVMPRQRP